MQAIMETIFDSIYLLTVITLGVIMIKKGKANNDNQYKLFGIMAILLGSGDAFHLVPRAYALFTIGLEANAVALGVGKLITSITMTVFYIVLYVIWKKRYNIIGHKLLTTIIYSLAIIRIALCLFPQNEWLSYSTPMFWSIYRNIPFAIMGIIIIFLFYKEVKKYNDKSLRFMSLAITMSFGFYIPVVLWAQTMNWIGILMIPKTLMYVWIVIMGYKMKKLNENIYRSK
ncbi:MAG: hypothetical protein KAG94_01955 [Clostridiales bacterium]|nr:hypothetical protein [Clostridiales bacterium]